MQIWRISGRDRVRAAGAPPKLQERAACYTLHVKAPPAAYSPFTAYLRSGKATSFFLCFSVFSDACRAHAGGQRLFSQEHILSQRTVPGAKLAGWPCTLRNARRRCCCAPRTKLTSVSSTTKLLWGEPPGISGMRTTDQASRPRAPAVARRAPGAL
jgi:hypothetical protein